MMSKKNIVKTKQICQTEWMTSKKLKNRQKNDQLNEDIPFKETN